MNLLLTHINAYDRAIELDPNNFKACFNKAITLEELGKYDLAIESYNTALEINPDYSEAKARKQAILDGT
nr:tetratricopeptide repeat protein [Rickettsia endosymbiont of Ceutorhynchus assimilis]